MAQDVEKNEKQILNEEEEKLLLDYDFDGIKEFDNPPPPWLMILFYATIFFSAIYYVNMHVFKTGLTQEERYEREMEKARATFVSSQTNITQETVAMEPLTDEASLKEGEEIYISHNCAACHGQNLEGLIGPNLTDEYWIHGNKVENLVDIISNGNIQKGMTPFKDQMTTEDMVKVASFILSKQGSNPPNAKAPEGDKY